MRRNAQVLKLLMERGLERGHFNKTSKSLFTAEISYYEEAANRDFASEGLELFFGGGTWYLGSYIGTWEELGAWVKTQVEASAHGVNVLKKTAKQQPQSAYAGLGMSLELKWKDLKRNAPTVGTLVGPIEEALRQTFLPALFRGEEVDTNFQEHLVHSVMHGSLGIPEPRSSL